MASRRGLEASNRSTSCELSTIAPSSAMRPGRCPPAGGQSTRAAGYPLAHPYRRVSYREGCGRRHNTPEPGGHRRDAERYRSNRPTQGTRPRHQGRHRRPDGPEQARGRRLRLVPVGLHRGRPARGGRAPRRRPDRRHRRPRADQLPAAQRGRPRARRRAARARAARTRADRHPGPQPPRLPDRDGRVRPARHRPGAAEHRRLDHPARRGARRNRRSTGCWSIPSSPRC